MGAVLKIAERDFDEVFTSISKIYDHAENILNIANAAPGVNDRDFIKEIETLVIKIEDAANTLAEDFSKVVESGKEPTSVMKMRVSNALRKILIVIDDYKKTLQDQDA